MPTLMTNPNRLPKADRLVGVEHFTPEQQSAHEMKVMNGLLCARDASTGDYQPLTTTGNVEKSPLGRSEVINRAIFALTPDGRFITSLNDKIGTLRLGKVFKHSTLTAGGPSAANGEIEVVKGKIKYLSNVSGHYQPNLEVWSQLLDWLAARGIDTSETKIRLKLFPPQGGDSTAGYDRIDNAEARDVAGRLHLGAFKSERSSIEGERILDFAFGSLVLDPGAAGTLRMAHTQVGPVPGPVLADAAQRGLTTFNSIIVGKKGVTYKFEPPRGRFSFADRFRSSERKEELKQQAKIPVLLPDLPQQGIHVDARGLSQADALYDLV